MNTVFTFTFLCCLTFSLATSPPKLECKNLSGKSDLDLNKYFNGNWYLTSIDKPLLAPLQVCQVSKSLVKDDGSVHHVISANFKESGIKFIKADCTANAKDIAGGKVTFSCIAAPINTTFTLQLAIIETDYNSFGIFQACSMHKDGRIVSDHILIVHRNIGAELTNAKIDETLKQLGMNLDNFETRKSLECEDDPSFAQVEL